MNLFRYINFVNESFESKKIKGILSYINGEPNRRKFIWRLKSVCENYDLLLSKITDDSFVYLSVLDLEDELIKDELIKLPFYIFTFQSNGNLSDGSYIKNQREKEVQFENIPIIGDFCLVLNFENLKDSSKGLKNLKNKRKEQKIISNEKDIFNILGTKDPSDFEKVSRQLKRLFGGSYPLFYIIGLLDKFSDVKRVVMSDNLNFDGALRHTHNFNIKLINVFSIIKDTKTFEKLMEINSVIKNKIDRFTIEDYDDYESFSIYLTTIYELITEVGIFWDLDSIINGIVDKDIDNSKSSVFFEKLDFMLKIIKKI